MTIATFILSDGMLTTGASLPMEMLNAASTQAFSRDKQSEPITIQTAAMEAVTINTTTGFSLAPQFAIDAVDHSDIVYLPGLWRNPRPILRQSQSLLDWIQKRYQQGTIFAAVGTGCCFLAEAGLLDDKPATTHWHYFDQFQRDYPTVKLKRQHFITQAGNLYCAASVNSLADLTVHFIHRLYGQSVASMVERHFSHEIRQPFDSTCYFEDKPDRHADEEITQIQMWLQDNYPREILLHQLAERFEISTRTLNRRFKQATGKTPLEYLQRIRIEVGKDLLKTTNLSIAEVAYKVGYQDASHFSRLFRQRLTTSPSDYRTTVRAKLFSPQ